MIDEKVSVGVNSDCSSITVGTCDKEILDIDIFDASDFSVITFTVPVALGITDVAYGAVHPTFIRQEEVYSISPNGLDQYSKIRDSRDLELLCHSEIGECQTDDIVFYIINSIMRNEDTPDGVNMSELAEKIRKAIKPLINLKLNRGIPAVRCREQKQD